MPILRKVTCAGLLALAAMAWAEPAPTSPGASQDTASEARISYRISLEEATRLALANNFDIQLARYDAWIARTDQGVAESIYDTIATAEVEYQNDQSKQTSTLAGTKAVDNDYNLGISKKLPTGTTVSADIDNNRHWGNSSFATSPLTHESTLGVSVTQELGRNFFGFKDRGNIKITYWDIENSEYTSLEKIEQSLASVQRAYWDVVLETERVRVAEEMVAQAQRLYTLNQEKFKDGLAETVEVTASEASYEMRKNELLLARNALDAKGNVLKLLLNVTPEDVLLEPSETFSSAGGAVEFAASLKKALEARRDYKKVLNEVKSKDLNLVMKKNDLWPEINLTASLERNGLGDHFKQAIRQIGEEDNPNFFAGLEISFPLENTGAKAQSKAAELEKARALVNLKLVERKISVDVFDQVRDCRVYHELAANRAVVAELQQQKLTEEEKRFSYGRSDTDTLIRYQEDWLKSREAQVAAMHLYQTALVDLALVEGSLLDEYWKTVGFEKTILDK